MSKLIIPKEEFNNLEKPNKLLLISFLTIIFADFITILNFDFLDLKTKIIISLVIFSLVLIFDIIVLYTQYYKFYYQTEYYNKIYKFIDTNVDSIDKSISNLAQESLNIKDSINEVNKEIEFLKSKIS